jgi:phosphoglycolate phosphatase
VSFARIASADAVLFDLDGVIADSRVPFVRCVNSALAEHGLAQRPAPELYRYLGPPLHNTFQTLVSDPTLVQPCIDSYRARYRAKAASETTIFPGIVELLDELAARLPLVVATSKPRALAEPLLEALDLRRCFLAVVGPELDSEDEQKSITVGRALRKLAASARAVMVGDREHDVIGAHAHEIPAIGVLWGIGSERELRDAGADALADTPAALAALLAPTS